MERKKIKQKLEEWFEIYKEKSIGNIDYKFDQTASTQEIRKRSIVGIPTSNSRS